MNKVVVGLTARTACKLTEEKDFVEEHVLMTWDHLESHDARTTFMDRWTNNKFRNRVLKDFADEFHKYRTDVKSIVFSIEPVMVDETTKGGYRAHEYDWDNDVKMEWARLYVLSGNEVILDVKCGEIGQYVGDGIGTDIEDDIPDIFWAGGKLGAEEEDTEFTISRWRNGCGDHARFASLTGVDMSKYKEDRRILVMLDDEEGGETNE